MARRGGRCCFGRMRSGRRFQNVVVTASAVASNVAANDIIQFCLALGGNNPIFDFENEGAVSASDFIQFRLRFGGSI